MPVKSVRIFNDNDRIVNNDTQRKDETEHDDHVHGEAHPRKDHVGNEDGEGY